MDSAVWYPINNVNVNSFYRSLQFTVNREADEAQTQRNGLDVTDNADNDPVAMLFVCVMLAFDLCSIASNLCSEAYIVIHMDTQLSYRNTINCLKDNKLYLRKNE